MQSLEGQLFASGMPEAALMEKVGQAMAARLLRDPQWLASGVLVLVGPGHNGGDGLVVARELFHRGVEVRIWCPLPIRRPLTEAHLRHLTWLGVERCSAPPDACDHGLWLEALFGVGQTRPLPEGIAQLLSDRATLRPRGLISLDVPAGLCSETGRPLGTVVAKAWLTLSVGLIKQGLCLDPARPFVGELERIDLGLAQRQIADLADQHPRRFGSADLSAMPRPQLSPIAMKYERGRVLVIAGSVRYPGAGHLCLQGALASGCGSVQALLPQRLQEQLWSLHPEVVLVDDGMRQGVARLDAVVFGPGLGADGSIWRDWKDRLRRFEGLLVLDADGLNGLASDPEGWRWLLDRAGPTWLTPHQAEFRRLFPEVRADSALLEAQGAAQLSGAVILLKGAHSVIADPEHPALVLDGTTATAARTGFGDVLAGLAAGWGALMRASAQPLTGSGLAAASLIHAVAAQTCGSSRASAIASTAELLVQKLMKQDEYFEMKISS